MATSILNRFTIPSGILIVFPSWEFDKEFFYPLEEGLIALHLLYLDQRKEPYNLSLMPKEQSHSLLPTIRMINATRLIFLEAVSAEKNSVKFLKILSITSCKIAP